LRERPASAALLELLNGFDHLDFIVQPPFAKEGYMRHAIQLAMLLSCVFSSSCSFPSGRITTTPPADVVATNSVRKKLGIREIQADWTFYAREFGVEKWNDSPDGHCKIVKRPQEGGGIEWEEDYYYSGSSYVDVDGTVWERLTVHYDYGSARFTIDYTGVDGAIKRIINSLSDVKDGWMGSSDAETLKAVDTILKFWKRIEYPFTGRG
jgi:hypothetical protein